MKPLLTESAWAERGKWLVDKLTERTLPDGRCVLEISEEPIWCKPDGTLARASRRLRTLRRGIHPMLLWRLT